ncbi:MAG: hypothetical protein LBJ67_10535 [Planctomycetaceae bacterium]|nr:hypothetical protein [Planctomycetaceae bacterium]
MTCKYFQQHYVCRLLLFQFIFWAVCGQGLHLWEHSGSRSYFYSHSKIQRLHHSHANNLTSSSKTHDSEHCLVCSFYQSLQHTFWVSDTLLTERNRIFETTNVFRENRLSVFDGITGLFLRGPPFIS